MIKLLNGISNFLLWFCRWIQTILVCLDIGEHFLVQRRRWKRKEIYVTIRWSQITWHWARVHVTPPYIRTVQSWRTQRVQSELIFAWVSFLNWKFFTFILGLQTTWVVLWKCWRSWFMESILPKSWSLSRKGQRRKWRRGKRTIHQYIRVTYQSRNLALIFLITKIFLKLKQYKTNEKFHTKLLSHTLLLQSFCFFVFLPKATVKTQNNKKTILYFIRKQI